MELCCALTSSQMPIFLIFIFCFTTSYCEHYHIPHIVPVSFDPFVHKPHNPSKIRSADLQFPHLVAQNGCDTHCEAVHFHSSQSFHFYSMHRDVTLESPRSAAPHPVHVSTVDQVAPNWKLNAHSIRYIQKLQHNAQVFDLIRLSQRFDPHSEQSDL